MQANNTNAQGMQRGVDAGAVQLLEQRIEARMALQGTQFVTVDALRDWELRCEGGQGTQRTDVSSIGCGFEPKHGVILTRKTVRSTEHALAGAILSQKHHSISKRNHCVGGIGCAAEVWVYPGQKKSQSRISVRN